VTARARLLLVAAAALAGGIVVASAAAFFIVRTELRARVDDALERDASRIAGLSAALRSSGGRARFLRVASRSLRGPDRYVQLVAVDGAVTASSTPLPAADGARAVARGGLGPFFSDARVSGEHVRLLTLPIAPGLALQLGRPLTDVDDALGRIELWLLVVVLAGVLVAACLALVVPFARVTPLERLTRTAEHVSRTGDLRSRVDLEGSADLGRLAASFNSMLEALESAVRSQRQLVADASHELATPLTSLRTNIDVLLRNEVLSGRARERLTRHVSEQLGELSDRLGELVELAHGDQRASEAERIRLDRLVEREIARAERDFPHARIVSVLEPTVVDGVPALISRAVLNLVENAAKWSPVDRDVEIRLAGGALSVRDHGPGISEQELPRVFDRFYRSREARGAPGSGLGLAIVKQVAEAHGGTVTAKASPGGGTELRLVLPVAVEVDTLA
jgi:two-component system sensor histidine kinase MprB